MRAMTFAKRNFIEMLRDPISYVFGIGLPIVMLVIMSVINNAIPPESNMVIFRIDNLSCGVGVFSLTFTMLCTVLLVSKDRSTAFLQRLYSSPMTAFDFIFGYALPMFIIALIQLAVCFGVSAIIAAISHINLTFSGVFFAFLSLAFSSIFFIALGIIFGFLLSDKASPPVCSIIITLSGLLGGIWFDSAIVGGFLHGLCKVLPFLNAVSAARLALVSDAGAFIPLLVVLAYNIVAVIVAYISFKARRKI